MKVVVNDKKCPVEDACKAFNILMKIAPYGARPPQKSDQDDLIRSYNSIIAKIRHSVHEIPKE